MSARDLFLQLGFVLIAVGTGLAVMALFPRIGPWREEPIADDEPEKVIESTARRKAARPRKKAASAPRKAAR